MDDNGWFVLARYPKEGDGDNLPWKCVFFRAFEDFRPWGTITLDDAARFYDQEEAYVYQMALMKITNGPVFQIFVKPGLTASPDPRVWGKDDWDF